MLLKKMVSKYGKNLEMKVLKVESYNLNCFNSVLHKSSSTITHPIKLYILKSQNVGVSYLPPQKHC